MRAQFLYWSGPMRVNPSDLEWGWWLNLVAEAGSSTGGEWRMSEGANIVILSSWQQDNSYTSLSIKPISVWPRPAGNFCPVFDCIGGYWRFGGPQSSWLLPGPARTCCQGDTSHLTEHFDTRLDWSRPVSLLSAGMRKEDRAEVILNKLSDNKINCPMSDCFVWSAYKILIHWRFNYYIKPKFWIWYNYYQIKSLITGNLPSQSIRHDIIWKHQNHITNYIDHTSPGTMTLDVDQVN